jgi:hypothetical protein
MDDNGKPIYFDGIDNSAYITGKAAHAGRGSWIYIDSESFSGARADIVDCYSRGANACLLWVRTNACRACALKAQCTKGPQRRIKRWEDDLSERGVSVSFGSIVLQKSFCRKCQQF